MQKEEREIDHDSLLCPSFSTYSSNNLAAIANQVITNSLQQNGTDLNRNDNEEQQNDDDDSDFEFVAFRKAADSVSFGRREGFAFPVFNRDIHGTPATERDGGRISGAEEIRISMEKLMIGDAEERRRSRRDPPSSSSSEVDDDLDVIPEGTYCVWTPNSVQASPNRCKKSNSTGSSSSSPSPAKKWKLLDLLRRSKSDGKNSFVFLTPSSSSSSSSSSLLRFGSKNKKEKKEEKRNEVANVKSKEARGGGSGRSESGGGDVAGKRSAPPSPARMSAHEALYVRNREMRRVDKRRSYLPYRQDLVGFCASLNAMGGRTFPPF